MNPYLQDADVTIYHGDALDTLRRLPDESAHMACTSPPFYGLRDYGTGRWDGGDPECDHLGRPYQNPAVSTLSGHGADGSSPYLQSLRTHYRDTCGKCGARRVDQQIGLEPTPDEWVARLVEVFRELRRVLRSDGTFWLEVGDSYASNPAKGGSGPNGKNEERWGYDRAGRSLDGLKPKDLIGAPFLLALALRADGWYWRSHIVWAKPNPMPESVTDRPTVSHSNVFLFAKSPRYFYDADAIREPYQPSSLEREKYGLSNAYGSQFAGSPTDTRSGKVLQPGEINSMARGPDGRRKTTVEGGDGSHQHRNGERWPGTGRNKRSVWNIATEPYAEAHFATWPTRLVEPMILAGSPEGGTVVDPFGGSGTTAHVARKHGRRSILIELNEQYCELAARRLSQQSLFAEGGRRV